MTDIRDLITIDDVMEEIDLGPNGGLVYCMEYLISHSDWLEEQLGTLPPQFERAFPHLLCIHLPLPRGKDAA